MGYKKKPPQLGDLGWIPRHGGPTSSVYPFEMHTVHISRRVKTINLFIIIIVFASGHLS